MLSYADAAADAGPTLVPPRNHPGGELVTLDIALVICLAMAKEDLRNAVHAQLCPRWRRALDARPIETKPMFTGGRLVHKRALPTAVAMQLLQEWIPDAIETIRREMRELAPSLAAWDQAALLAAAGGLEIVDDAEEEDHLNF
jgi:hypothetical protein